MAHLRNTSQMYFVGILILSVVGFILTLSTDWGGYVHWDSYYGAIDYYIYFFSMDAGFLVWVPLFGIFVGFAFSGYVALLGLRWPTRLTPRHNDIGFIVSAAIVVIDILGLILFAILASDTEWWADTAFYASLIGGILNTVLFWLIRQEK